MLQIIGEILISSLDMYINRVGNLAFFNWKLLYEFFNEGWVIVKLKAFYGHVCIKFFVCVSPCHSDVCIANVSCTGEKFTLGFVPLFPPDPHPE